MTDEGWRCFVAIPIDDALRADLARAVAAWRRRSDLAELRWTEPSSWHVTLAFLGPTDPARVSLLLELLHERAAGHGRMRLTSGGLGAFPSAARARVAWYGVADPRGQLARLADDVRGALEIAASGPFRAHVTLARSRSVPVDVRAWVATASAPAGRLDVDRLLLMRSLLGGRAARHESLGSVLLGVPAHV